MRISDFEDMIQILNTLNGMAPGPNTRVYVDSLDVFCDNERIGNFYLDEGGYNFNPASLEDE